ncbi:MAG: hypothetical protein HY913_23220 [Desulfomonile tiedjei]|nr:hypothetical protein [Desulfomonile tiedjei]
MFIVRLRLTQDESLWVGVEGTMNAQSGFQTYETRLTRVEEQLRREFAHDVIREFGPILAPYGFTDSGWSHDPELDMIQVFFEDPQRRHAVQIDCNLRDGSFTSNYCRNEADWEICGEGKAKSFAALKDSIRRWIEANCEECCLNCATGKEVWEEDEYALVPCSRCDDTGKIRKLSP